MTRTLGVALAALSLAALAHAGDNSGTSLPAEISRSGGDPNGVVILWPRIIPSSDSTQVRQDAAFVQQELKAAVERILPGMPVEIRPEPERVCPRKGCDGIAVGALFAHKEQGCAVVAMVSPPGMSEATLVPMAGRMDVKARKIPFREPAESYVTVYDFDRCVELAPNLELRISALEGALRTVANRPAASVTGGGEAPTSVVIPH